MLVSTEAVSGCFGVDVDVDISLSNSNSFLCFETMDCDILSVRHALIRTYRLGGQCYTSVTFHSLLFFLRLLPFFAFSLASCWRHLKSLADHLLPFHHIDPLTSHTNCVTIRIPDNW